MLKEKKEFLPQYKNCMDQADLALVYFSPSVVAHKKLESISIDQVFEGFGGGITVATNTNEVCVSILCVLYVCVGNWRLRKISDKQKINRLRA